MTDAHPQNLVLAIYPFSRGFAFVYFEGPESPFDWGVKEIKEKRRNAKTFAAIKKLIDRYRPAMLVIENTANGGSRRSSRIRKLYRMLVHLAAAEYIDVYRCERRDAERFFASIGATRKHEVARAIAAQIPAFAHRLPPLRKAWVGEDPRQSLFDAVALALVYYRQTATDTPNDIGSA